MDSNLCPICATVSKLCQDQISSPSLCHN